jgi:hypothetical protein
MAAPSARFRNVIDPGSRKVLGFACAFESATWPGIRWLARRVMEVYETEDASLVCTMSRSWALAWGWNVKDADDRRVAVVHKRVIVQSTGRVLAVTELPAGLASGRFLNPRGMELGSFCTGTEGTSLTLAPILEGDPFSRMALLAAVLSYDW